MEKINIPTKHDLISLRKELDYLISLGTHINNLESTTISSSIEGLKIEIVKQLPSTPSDDTIYIVSENAPTPPGPTPPEPPVTPKVIATIDVFDHYQQIVGVVTDAETGDSIAILPKSFEVDGIPQPLDAIDTEGYLGAYTFETLGEHTITYEFDNPTTIPTHQFAQVNLTSVQLPVGITSIGDYAFVECAFTNIEIPESITSIGERAFAGCLNLTSITVNATTPPTLGFRAFESTNNCPIFVPDASVDAYKTAWSDYADRIQAIQE